MTAHNVDDDLVAKTSFAEPAPRAADHLRAVTDAHSGVTAAKNARIDVGISAARARLQRAVDTARSAGVGWTQIGDAVGIRRGNAYQKFRRRPPAARY